jgi:hypothetical protein
MLATLPASGYEEQETGDPGEEDAEEQDGRYQFQPNHRSQEHRQLNVAHAQCAGAKAPLAGPTQRQE